MTNFIANIARFAAIPRGTMNRRYLLMIALAIASESVAAESVTATVPTSSRPSGIAINPVTVTDASGGSTSNAFTLQTFVTNPTLLRAVSRKTHGVAGEFDLPIDQGQSINGSVTVEPRALGGGHVIVFEFNSPINSANAGATNGNPATILAGVTAVPIGNSVIVTLPVSDNTRVSVGLSGVNGGSFQTAISVGFLLGDVNGSRSIDEQDVVATKARAGQNVGQTNFMFDLNLSGAIAAGDIAAVKARSGRSLSLACFSNIPGECSIEGSPIPSPSKIAQIIPPVHAGLNGAGANINAWAVNPAACDNTQPPITRLWRHNIDFVDHGSVQQSDFFDMAPNEALMYKFVSSVGGIGSIAMMESTQAPRVATFISLSTKPCDFNGGKLVPGPSRDYCYVSSVTDNELLYEETNGAVSFGRCKLVPGTAYYLSMRFQNGVDPGTNTLDSCAASGSARCGGLLRISR